MDIAMIGAGSVGRALAGGFAAAGHSVTFGVREPSDARHAGLGRVALPAEAAAGAAVVVLAVPVDALESAVPGLGLVPGQIVVDATNAVRTPVPEGFTSVGELTASLVPDGVAVAKAFNTVGAEHLADGRGPGGPTFLPIAGDPAATEVIEALATEVGFDVAVLGGRERFGMVEDHARLWIHLAFGCGWGRGFAFTVGRS